MALLKPPSSSPGWYKYRTFTREGSFFSFKPTGLKYLVAGSEITTFSFIAAAGFHTNQPSDLVVQSRNNFGKSFYPLLENANPQLQTHFNCILIPKQTLSQGAIETFNDSLVSVNFRMATSDRSFVFFHFLCNSAHKFTPRINLQHLWPFQRSACVNYLECFSNLSRIFGGQRLSFFESAGNINNGKSVFEGAHGLPCHVAGKEDQPDALCWVRLTSNFGRGM